MMTDDLKLRFDRITALAAGFFGAPCALTMLDAGQRWVASSARIEAAEEATLAWALTAVPAASPRVLTHGTRSVLVAAVDPSDAAAGAVVVLGAPARTFSPEETAAAGAFAALAADAIAIRSTLADPAHGFADDVTGVPNRFFFERRLRALLGTPDGSCVGVGLLDLDRFKAVNDTYGHRAGDDVLERAARLLAQALRPGDLLARRGGDEFLLLLPDVDAVGATTIGERLCAALRDAATIGDVEVAIRASVGLTLVEPGSGPVDALADRALHEADVAMYEAKKRGDVAVLYSPAIATAYAPGLEPSLSRALSAGELSLHYQPQIDSSTGDVIGCEALLRWNHPERGLLAPAEFLAIAEESGLIVPIGTFVIEEACRAARGWHDAGAFLTVAVNVSPRQVESGTLVEVTEAALRASGIAPRYLELEISERVVLSANDRALETLARLKALGVRLTVDDFGTGYSNFASLGTRHIDGLKIDKSFVDRLYPDGMHAPRSVEIVRAIVGLARSLDLTMVAEGVETAHQRDVLQALACTGMQGFFWSTPLPHAEMHAWLCEAGALTA